LANLIALDAEGVLNDFGSVLAVVGADCPLKKVGYACTPRK
jgi:hypothetical protein